MRRIDDRHVQPKFNCMMQKNAVDQLAGRLRQTKRDIADTQACVHTGQFGFDRLNTLQRFHSAAAPNLLPGCQGKSERIKNQILRL